MVEWIYGALAEGIASQLVFPECSTDEDIEEGCCWKASRCRASGEAVDGAHTELVGEEPLALSGYELMYRTVRALAIEEKAFLEGLKPWN